MWVQFCKYLFSCSWSTVFAVAWRGSHEQQWPGKSSKLFDRHAARIRRSHDSLKSTCTSLDSTKRALHTSLLSRSSGDQSCPGKYSLCKYYERTRTEKKGPRTNLTWNLCILALKLHFIFCLNIIVRSLWHPWESLVETWTVFLACQRQHLVSSVRQARLAPKWLPVHITG